MAFVQQKLNISIMLIDINVLSVCKVSVFDIIDYS